MEPEQRFDDHVECRCQIVAPPNVMQLVRDDRVELVGAERRFEADRHEQHGPPDADDAGLEETGRRTHVETRSRRPTASVGVLARNAVRTFSHPRMRIAMTTKQPQIHTRSEHAGPGNPPLGSEPRSARRRFRRDVSKRLRDRLDRLDDRGHHRGRRRRCASPRKQHRQARSRARTARGTSTTPPATPRDARCAWLRRSANAASAAAKTKHRRLPEVIDDRAGH